jgi:hypothetical protein
MRLGKNGIRIALMRTINSTLRAMIRTKPLGRVVASPLHVPLCVWQQPLVASPTGVVA